MTPRKIKTKADSERDIVEDEQMGRGLGLPRDELDALRRVFLVGFWKMAHLLLRRSDS